MCVSHLVYSLKKIIFFYQYIKTALKPTRDLMHWLRYHSAVRELKSKTQEGCSNPLNFKPYTLNHLFVLFYLLTTFSKCLWNKVGHEELTLFIPKRKIPLTHWPIVIHMLCNVRSRIIRRKQELFCFPAYQDEAQVYLKEDNDSFNINLEIF